jgi:apolipoprotein D and lipocalin family protein
MRGEWWSPGQRDQPLLSHWVVFAPISDLHEDLMTANIFLITFLTFIAYAAVAVEVRKDELEVVQSVDLTRYAGRWYEIARLPNSFQKKCADSVTANYTMREDGKIEVINRCRKASGEYATAQGEAKIVDKKTNAKLKVTFFWPFYGDYWILDLGPNYEYAVVGDPDRKYLWILSRSPRMDEALYQQLLQNMAAKGFNTEMMIRTSQPLTEPEVRSVAKIGFAESDEDYLRHEPR